MASANRGGRTVNSAGHVEARDYSSVHVGNKYTKNIYNEPNHNRCIADLRLTDPRDDKTRIEETQGGLLKDSYKWILDHEDFRRWRDDRESRLLWIKGDAGKGKTMLLCGIVNELLQSRVALRLLGGVAKMMPCRFKESPLSLTHARHVSFFFCQGTDSRLNHATAVLRGLIYLLLCQVPSLISHIQQRYDHAGRRLFEDTNVFYTLSQVLASMLRDRRAKGCYMIIDALDECKSDLPQLLDFIVQSTATSTQVRWIVSSRNRHEIEQQLHLNASRLSLELNADHVTDAINTYIDYKVAHLVSLEGNKPLQNQVRDEMRRKADGTFLWVALVAKELQKVQSWDISSVLGEMRSGLTLLYERMMIHIQQLQPKDRKRCCLVLSMATVAYRPLQLCELGVLSDLTKNMSGNPRSIEGVVNKSGSFLTIRDGHVYLIHQSVKDFLTTEGSATIFQHGFANIHYTMFSKSADIMSETLRRDIYDLHDPGISIDKVRQPNPDPLASARYSCIYWVDHLIDVISHIAPAPIIDDLHDDNTIYEFLSKRYLYWLEALGLLGAIPDGVMAMTKLETLLERPNGSFLFNFVRDARRFVLSHGWIIGQAPLQAYASALIFSPRRSITRRLFAEEEPSWIVAKPAIAEDWNACLATLEDHDGPVYSVVFSPDGQRLASASSDKTVKTWDATTSHCQATFNGHGDWVRSVVFSPDGTRLASASDDKTVKIWDATTGDCQATLKDHSASVYSVAFSPDGQRLVSASGDTTVKMWDATTGLCQATLRGHKDSVSSVAFSPDDQRLASASRDNTVKIWDATMGHCQATLEGHSAWIYLVVFSPGGLRLASASYDQTIRIWDATTGHCQTTLKGHSTWVRSVAFSPNGMRLASASNDKTVKIWDATTGQFQATLSIGSIVDTIRFDTTGTRLLTDYGTLDLNLLSPSSSPSTALPTSGLRHRQQHQGYGISADRKWIYAWVDDPGPPRASRLYYACFCGLARSAKDLMAEGADIDVQGGRYGTALQAASSEGYPEIVQLLLDKGADINAQGGYYGNALQAASVWGHGEVMQLLLDNGADANRQGGEYGNALQGTPYKRKVVQTPNHEGADTTSGKRSGSATQKDPAKQPRPLDPTDVGRT
ncbi:hypothetical protein FOCG_13867 [Fusarium oxysporum f. sp. radicis-lycopersici 26381]|nr:hypothetical protein FOCG_13867 [Fusarium oxysporum f. sp. radicis-lycopersici 26381]